MAWLLATVDPLDEAEDDEELFKNEIVIEFKKDDQGWKKKFKTSKKYLIPQLMPSL